MLRGEVSSPPPFSISVKTKMGFSETNRKCLPLYSKLLLGITEAVFIIISFFFSAFYLFLALTPRSGRKQHLAFS